MIRITGPGHPPQIMNDPNQLAAVLKDGKACWYDLLCPTPAEEAVLEKHLGIALPTQEDMQDIEVSSRLYKENGAYYLTATLLHKADSDMPETTNVAFVLHGGVLVTIRYAEPKPFSMFQAFAEKHGDVCTSGAAALAGLLEAVVDRTAELLERTGLAIDAQSQKVFARRKNPKAGRGEVSLEHMLTEIAFQQNLTAKVRESLVSLGRLVGFVALAKQFEGNADLKATLQAVRHDIEALNDQSSFLSANMSFLLDASLGLINIDQNAIIKTFSIASVVLLPPTLVASIYGMNFAHMPELSWQLGYPLAVLLMVVSAVLPYLWFKHKGWL